MNDQRDRTAFRMWEAVCCKAGDYPFAVLYEDEQLIVCKKAPGIPVQSASLRTKDMVSLLKTYLQTSYLGVVHRLDQPVQGLIVFAKTPLTAAALSRQTQDGTMQKEYCCVCSMTGKTEIDIPAKEQGTLIDYLLKDGRTNCSRVVGEGTPGAKQAVLDYEIAGEKDGKCLVKIRLHTGRHHQIRVQLAHAGLPIAGDQKYGSNSGETDTQLKLCAYRLSFVHPKTGKQMTFTLEEGGTLYE